MRLTIDIGNTNTKVFIFGSDKPKHVLTLLTKDSLNLRVLYKLCILSKKCKIVSCGISSVVINKEKEWISYIKKIFEVEPLIINYKTKLPINVKVNNGYTLGADRICNASAGYQMYKRKKSVVVVDFGTAVTFNVVMKNGSFVGGAIMPGLQLMSKALAMNTSQLPEINIKRPAREVIGNSTKKAIESGVYHSILSSIYGIISLIQGKLGYKVKVILTGSNKLILKTIIHKDWIYEPNMVSVGINAILKCNNL